ncbi:hypothetical protein AYO38_04665 [bacterium SCGC AG-212-C10]|nr:hypothetical protein AYO38_04665 [bacterium SCGC AG-212-C10]
MSLLVQLRNTPRLALGVLVAILLLFEGGVKDAGAASQIYVVDRLDDSAVAGALACTAAPNDCTFRGALNKADTTTDLDTITFDLPGAGPHTIVLASALNTQNEPVTIDGYCATCDGATPNKSIGGGNAVLKIEINGAAVGPTGNCINFNPLTGTTLMQGLVWNRCAGVAIRIGGSAENVHLEGNYIGTNLAGTAPGPGNGVGIVIAGDNTFIGGATAGTRNLISGNVTDGIRLDSTGTSTNTTLIRNNFIGVNKGGTAAVANGGSGIVVGVGTVAPANTTIGSAVLNTRNVISGNGSHGILVVAAAGLTVLNNDVGLGVGGMNGVGNDDDGIRLQTSGGTLGPGNVIGNNGGVGIHLAGQSATGNAITGNKIGTNAAGTALMATINNGGGILVEGPNNVIGAATDAAGPPSTCDSPCNLVSGNSSFQVRLQAAGNRIAGNWIGPNANGSAGLSEDGLEMTAAANSSVISGNFISGHSGAAVVVNGSGTSFRRNFVGTNATGTAALPNGTAAFAPAVEVIGTGNAIGGAAAADRNVISGNTGAGLQLTGGSNTVTNNRIGTNAAGTAPVANQSGLGIASSSNTNVLTGNTVSGNTISGIFMRSNANTLKGNFIGTNSAGSGTVPNGGDGIQDDEGDDNLIGGTGPGEANIISGNGGSGIVLVGGGGGPLRNHVVGNKIGTDTTGMVALGNGSHGIDVQSFAQDTTIRANVLSGNQAAGVNLGDGGTKSTLTGNLIGTNAAGASAIPNQSVGVRIASDANTIGGLNAGDGNVVSGNVGSGIFISGDGPAGNKVVGNLIGVNGTGSAAIPNAQGSGITIDNSVPPPINTEVRNNTLSGNGLSGLDIQDGSQIVVKGNRIGIGLDGLTPIANQRNGISVQDAEAVTIGGSLAGDRNIISSNARNGIDATTDTGLTIQGNFIGLAADGMTSRGNQTHGIVISAGTGVFAIGGPNAGQGNVIAANCHGIDVHQAATQTVNILGNFIGVAADAVTARGNSCQGISLEGSGAAFVGGVDPGQANIIAFNGDGVRPNLSFAAGKTIRGNSIHDNTGKGILHSLGGGGGVNAPIINPTGGIAGTSACFNCTLDVYSDFDEEGLIFEGSTTTSGTGTWTFAGPVTGPHATATVTNAAGSTSEFSLPRTLTAPDETLTVNSTGDEPDASANDGHCLTAGGTCTLRAALAQADLSVDFNRITFDIPANSAGCVATLCTIETASSLPGLNQPTLIDGYTQPGSSANTAPFGTNAQLKIVLVRTTPGTTLSVSTGVTLRGLVLPRGDLLVSNGGTVVGSFIGTTADGLGIGGAAAGISAIRSTNNDAFVGGPGLADRNLIAGTSTGLSMTSDASIVLINNLIGTDRTGLAALPGQTGIGVNGATTSALPNDAVVIGGDGPGEGNVIAGWATGIDMSGRPFTAEGNLIGVGANGSTPVPNGQGIFTGGPVHAPGLIGGTTAGARNVIAFNTDAGVRIEGSAIGANARTVRGNSVRSNGGKGILRGLGAEGDIAVPVVAAASTVIASGSACSGCTVEVFSDSGSQGATFHGLALASGAGAWTFSCQLACPMSGPNVTATATTSDGNTSEFSSPMSILIPLPQIDATAPTTIVRGSADTVLTVTGTGFVPGASQLTWNGAVRSTTVNSATTLQALILSADLQVIGDHSVRVTNPPPGGGDSSVLLVRVRSRADTNCDLNLTLSDASHVLRSLVALDPAVVDCVPDADGDGNVTASDALLVLRVLAGLVAVP